MKLSGVVTCFNSAETLARCLQILQFCDEIIVLDSGSSDASVAIAKAHDAQLQTHVLRSSITDPEPASAPNKRS